MTAAAVISQYFRKYMFDNDASPNVTTPFDGVVITNNGQKNSFQVHMNLIMARAARDGRTIGNATLQ
jgi:hypothetical protein